MSFAKYIKSLRETHGLTQLRLSELLNISLVNIKKIESGETKTPNSRFLENIAAFTRQDQVHVMREIFFNDNADYDCNPTELLKSFVSYSYNNGWNFEMYPSYDSGIIGRRMFDCLLTKKRDAPNRVIVHEMGAFPQILEISKSYEQTVLFFVDRVKDIKYIMEENKFRSYFLILDSASDKDTQIFNNIINYDLSLFNIKIDVILFDSVNMTQINMKSL
ncbi:MAG: helix-turn-helix transcriptional regulator [Longicatena sp.]|uniref:helix-turn-helix domain-containing protein n=1 Tax=Anaerorhabdus sp. TaxID=1872524 RepID=UPI002FCB9516